ncbi:bZIP transcription factor TGA10-like isoform X2 [Zingiber officinale]|uniref:bZIP transcription factor TGA10-like isoform X2 n=1 Tax=Zingiber officinale TaxID=94328 RepID=UPI001C4C1425|nr:bZIP transcription factor TGA10-like isoform X2 [Zingiber officinale]
MMASDGVSGHAQHQQRQISLDMLHPSPSSSASMRSSFNMKSSKLEMGSYDISELDQALFTYLDGQQDYPASAQEHRRALVCRDFEHFPLSTHACRAVDKGTGTTNSGGEGISLTSSASSGSKNISEQATEFCNIKGDHPVQGKDDKVQVTKAWNRKGMGGPKTSDPKTLRRLAQNREAARKSRLRKKAYIQQLETSRIKLTQIEHELHRAKAQGVLLGGGGLLRNQGHPTGVSGLISDETMFDMEYTRWLEEHHRLMCELRAAVQEQLQENELQMYVESCISHYDQMVHLKSTVIKSDVFHLISGKWMTPAERCFMWMGGFRPSELIKILSSHIDPLTEQQILAVCGMQQSMQEAEEALSQGLEALNQSLSETINSDAFNCPSDVANYMGHMAIAMNKLTTLEGFVRQADNLRQQALHRLHRILTTRQMARCLLAMAEYFHRLRALSSLWLARPRNDI